PETNNVLLSALEEKLLTLPPHKDRAEYIRVHSDFRVIFTSNPTEYCGVHGTQDALMDRLITINMPEPDDLTQQEIVIQKTKLDRISARFIVLLVKEFRQATHAKDSSGLRSGLIIAKICQDHDIHVAPDNADFRDICQDVLLSRSSVPLDEASQVLWRLFNTHINEQTETAILGVSEAETDAPGSDNTSGSTSNNRVLRSPQLPIARTHPISTESSSHPSPLSNTPNADPNNSASPLHPVSNHPDTPTDHGRMKAIAQGLQVATSVAPSPLAIESLDVAPDVAPSQSSTATAELNSLGLTTLTFKPSAATTPSIPVEVAPVDLAPVDLETESQSQPATGSDQLQRQSVPQSQDGVPYEREVYYYLKHSRDIRPSQIEAALGIDRFQTVNALRSLHEKGLLSSLQLPIPSVQPNPKGTAS
ncbi:MAG: hypothetical protein F6K30_21275, partial [Cyanothece sp. SIO2G6]|nr:hypothetical protein [Cyanothece sp. SIO2G6]